MGHNSLPHSQQRIGHSPKSKAMPFGWPRKHEYSSFSPFHTSCGMASLVCYPDSGEPILSSPIDGCLECTLHSAARGSHSRAGTLHPSLSPAVNDGPQCWGMWCGCRAHLDSNQAPSLYTALGIGKKEINLEGMCQSVWSRSIWI